MPRRACYGAGMDCQPAFRPAFAALSSLALAVSLSACASTSDRYPSLAIRDVERFYGSAQPVDANPAPPPPVQPSPELAQRLVQLQDQAAQAHQAFLSALPGTRSQVNAARNAAVASDSWVTAQNSISTLESSRSHAMLAMAELDQLLVQAETGVGARDAVIAAQAKVDGMVQEENTVLDHLVASLRN